MEVGFQLFVSSGATASGQHRRVHAVSHVSMWGAGHLRRALPARRVVLREVHQQVPDLDQSLTLVRLQARQGSQKPQRLLLPHCQTRHRSEKPLLFT